MKKSEEPVTLTNASYGGKGKGRAILTCSFLLHVALFAYWIAVHVHESSLMANAEFFSKGQHHFAKMSEFPGRWKYLTLVNMVCYVISRDTYFNYLYAVSADNFLWSVLYWPFFTKWKAPENIYVVS